MLISLPLQLFPPKTPPRAVSHIHQAAHLTYPVWDVIDRMYPELIHMGWLNAYVTTPPLFYQVCVCVRTFQCMNASVCLPISLSVYLLVSRSM